MEWIKNNWQDLVAVSGAIVMTARIIVKLTPTPVDDTILAKIVSVLKKLGLHLD